jgi:uncharacterized protein (DUF305 family)
MMTPKQPSDSISRMAVARWRLLKMSHTQIAETMGTTPQIVAAILLEPEVIEAMERAHASALKDTQEALRLGSLEVVQRLAKLVQSDDERIALEASKAWLTKAGADAPSKSESKNEHTGTSGPIQIVVGSPEELRQLAAPKSNTEEEP